MARQNKDPKPLKDHKDKHCLCLNCILDAASREVKSWPEWMQRPENRLRGG